GCRGGGQGEHGLRRRQAPPEPADREGPVAMGATVTPTPAPTEAVGAPIVSPQDATKSYGPIKALSGVTLDLRAGEVMCLAGENGAGKSTLIKILTGAIRRDEGAFLIDGDEVGNPSPAEVREAGIGVVYQELS